MLQLTENSSVRHLSGVGAVRAATLEKLGIKTIRDILWHFPRGYENRGEIRPLSQGVEGENGAYLLTVASYPKTVHLKNRMILTKMRAFDESGTVEVVFFNQPYLQTAFAPGDTYRFWGKLTRQKVWTLSSPQFEPYDFQNPPRDYVPLYPLTDGITRKIMDGLIESALSVSLTDPLPEDIRLKNGLPTRTWAVRAIHRPHSMADLEKGLRRMVFDELFCLALSIGFRKNSKRDPSMPPCKPCSLQPLLSLLPYQLTGAQKQVVNDIYRDLVSQDNAPIPPMRRILIGDVGSGKTICSVIAMYIAAMSGYSSAIMAPTEILAKQHHHSMSALFEKLGIPVYLLTSSTTQKERNRIQEAIGESGSGTPSILVGTHALLRDNIRFSNLGLTITDEQHRFGIAQRNTLQSKMPHTHTLVMSATPIPRTLAMSLYGDLDVSRIDELPKGRQSIDTFVIDTSYRERLYQFVKKQVNQGGQVYIVCPAIEAEDASQSEVAIENLTLSKALPPLTRVVEYANTLSKDIFPELNVDLLHGKMSPKEKDRVMKRFAEGTTHILVSTTVVEVGVDVPNASLMIVENAERFGLAQLHQLRGRVGRGSRKSYCVLVSDSQTELAKSRLNVLADTSDGYEIAEHDLALRGPGDFLGSICKEDVRQSGGVQLKLASCCNDTALLTAAFREANALIQNDPLLLEPENAPLKTELEFLFQNNQ